MASRNWDTLTDGEQLALFQVWTDRGIPFSTGIKSINSMDESRLSNYMSSVKNAFPNYGGLNSQIPGRDPSYYGLDEDGRFIGYQPSDGQGYPNSPMAPSDEGEDDYTLEEKIAAAEAVEKAAKEKYANDTGKTVDQVEKELQDGDVDAVLGVAGAQDDIAAREGGVKQMVVDESNESLADFFASESGMEMIKSSLKNKRASARSALVVRGLQSILDASDISMANRQVREGEKALRELIRPELRSFSESRELRDQLTRTREELDLQRRNRDLNQISAPLETLRGEQEETFRQDMSNAALASGGQAGAFGAMSQAAINRRYSNNRRLSDFIREDLGMRDERVGQAMDRVGQAAGAVASDDRSLDRLDLIRYRTELDQYRTDQENAAALASTGYANRRFARQNAVNQLPQVVQEANNPNLGFGRDIDEYARRVRNQYVNLHSDRSTFGV